MKKKNKVIIYFILTVVLLCGLVFLILNSNWFRMWRLESQLAEKYGTSFDVTDTEKDRPFLSESHTYDACSEKGIRFLAECSWYGKLISDSYAHFYYAEDMNGIIETYIKEYFDEFYVVRDCWEYGSNKSITELVKESDSASFEDYLKSDHEVTVTFRVYLRKNIKAGQLNRALEKFKFAGIDYSVYFLSVTDEIYEMVSGSGLKCYYPHSKVGETLLSSSDKVTDMDVENILTNPWDVTVAQYVPKYNRSEMTFSKNITRDYFRNLDRDYNLKDIVEEIGPYGIEGSGMWRFVWPINDGSKGKIMFDSSERIISIHIVDENGTETVFDRYE